MEARGDASEQRQIVGGGETTTKKKKMKKVVVAIDESEVSFNALGWVLDNLITWPGPVPDAAEELENLIVIHVQQPFQHLIIPAGPAVYTTPVVLDSVRKAQEQNSKMLLARASEICKERLVKVKTVILEGDPKDMICQAAEQMNADLLVLGSHGHGKIKRAFLGSVSDYCVHHAKCPVLIVKPSKEKEKKEKEKGKS
eukprot:TRINITY_DN19418_c0_g1_i1.p1 TRINITY_DN19418_c0_g1~~TRINITY_DN19418_c0_g1_i1.p1  ORF type:complete len:198 (+),score=47.60 TRINITY_DN19418_c0_g1_i1:26-619(+)